MIPSASGPLIGIRLRFLLDFVCKSKPHYLKSPIFKMKTLAGTLVFFLLSLQSFAQGKLITSINDVYPSVSPDGKWIVFSSDRSGKRALYIIDSSGNNLKQLTHFGWNEVSPKWSPDGSKIVFAAEPDSDNSEIFVVDRDGSNLVRLTNVRGDDSHPNWSPDGKKIIFNSARTSPDLTIPWSKQFLEIFEMNSDGSNLRQITNNKTISTYPCYAPDGKKIVFRKVTNDPGYQWDFTTGTRNSEIFICNPDGSNEMNLSKNASYDGWPVWSPDGHFIIFSSNREGPANSGALYSIRPDGTGLKRISSGNMEFVQAAFSPDGKYIYAHMGVETEEYEYGFIQRIPFNP